jgi:large subunit ribosomal protein L9
LGLSKVRVALHPEVSIPVTVNVARSPEEAERQARGERATGAAEEEAEDEDQFPTAENIFQGDTPQPN